MLPDNFDFAMLPTGSGEYFLEELGMLASTIEDIDYSLVSWLKEDLDLSTITNEGFKRVPVLWQVPERSFQVKHSKDLRDGKNIVLPVLSVERTAISKDPSRKGSFQAQIYSPDKNGRAGRFVVAQRIVPDKTRNFAVAAGTRTNTGGTDQRYYPRVNQKVVIQTLSIPIPVYISVDYKISIKTEYQQQMNDLIQPWVTIAGNSTMPPRIEKDNHKFEVFLDGNYTNNSNTSNLEMTHRNYETIISANVLGYLIGEGPNQERPKLVKRQNAVEFRFAREHVVVGDMPENIDSRGFYRE